MSGGKAHVGPGHIGQALGGVRESVDGGSERGVEKLVGLDRDGRQQIVAVGEMGIGSADGNTKTAADFGQRKAPHPSLTHELDGSLDERSSEVAIVVAISLAVC
jgi:hypothetical protein